MNEHITRAAAFAGQQAIIEVFGVDWLVGATEVDFIHQKVVLELKPYHRPMYKPTVDLSPEALTAAVWSGEGPPPVGCVCEVIVDGGAPGQGLITYTAGNLVCWKWKGQADDKECCAYIHRLSFKPLRTAEQLAAEVREATVKTMVDRYAIHDIPGVPWQNLFAQMYDAGLRFPNA